MKKFIFKTLLFLFSIGLIDCCFGMACRYLNSHSKGGDTKSNYYTAMECDEDILIFGSSRALHHFVPEIIEDSLKMSAYNCGRDGNGIMFLYGRLLMITQRYTPKIIVYDICPGFDLLSDDMTRYLGWQRRFYDSPGISEIFDDINPTEKYKMISQLYRYNGSWIQMLSDYIKPQQTVGYGGYKPLFATMDYEPQVTENDSLPMKWDETKKKYFEKFHRLCKEKNITLVFTYSPFYKSGTSTILQNMTDFCKTNDIPLLDYYSSPEFSLNRNFFKDSSHLNDTGAKEFTKRICTDLKNLVTAAR